MRRVPSVRVDWGRHPGWLVGAVAYPLITVVTVGSLLIALQGYARARDAANSEARTLAISAARDADRFVMGRIQVLGTVARAPLVEAGQAEQMQAYFARVLPASGLSEISWIDRQGNLRAHSSGLPAGGPVNFSDRDLVRAVLESGQPTVGAAVIGRITLAPNVPIGYPTFDEAGRISGLVATGVRLDGSLGEQIHFGGAPGLRVVDPAGRLIISAGPVTELRDVSGWTAYREARSGRAGVFHGPGIGGEQERVIAFATAERTGWAVLVDQPPDAVYGPTNEVMRLEIGGILLFAVVAGVGVSWGMIRLERDAARASAAEAAAEVGRQLRDELIAALGHDLGNPLTIIRGHAGLLRRRLPPEDTSPVEIEQSARRMQRMIQGLMDLSTRGDDVSLARDRVDLVPLARVLVEERELLDRGREFVLEAPEEHVVGEWDRMRVERAVDNLLSNAVKYSPPGSTVWLRVWRSDEASGEWAVVEVEDQGIGIPAAEQERVFEAFYRASNAAEQAGHGLGLSSVWRVATQHGGSVEIDSHEHQGTKVRIRLPLTGLEAEEDEEPDSKGEKRHVEGHARAG